MSYLSRPTYFIDFECLRLLKKNSSQKFKFLSTLLLSILSENGYELKYCLIIMC